MSFPSMYAFSLFMNVLRRAEDLLLYYFSLWSDFLVGSSSVFSQDFLIDTLSVVSPWFWIIWSIGFVIILWACFKFFLKMRNDIRKLIRTMESTKKYLIKFKKDVSREIYILEANLSYLHDNQNNFHEDVRDFMDEVDERMDYTYGDMRDLFKKLNEIKMMLPKTKVE